MHLCRTEFKTWYGTSGDSSDQGICSELTVGNPAHAQLTMIRSHLEVWRQFLVVNSKDFQNRKMCAKNYYFINYYLQNIVQLSSDLV